MSETPRATAFHKERRDREIEAAWLAVAGVDYVGPVPAEFQQIQITASCSSDYCKRRPEPAHFWRPASSARRSGSATAGDRSSISLLVTSRAELLVVLTQTFNLRDRVATQSAKRACDTNASVNLFAHQPGRVVHAEG